MMKNKYLLLPLMAVIAALIVACNDNGPEGEDDLIGPQPTVSNIFTYLEWSTTDTVIDLNSYFDYGKVHDIVLVPFSSGTYENTNNGDGIIFTEANSELDWADFELDKETLMLNIKFQPNTGDTNRYAIVGLYGNTRNGQLPHIIYIRMFQPCKKQLVGT